MTYKGRYRAARATKKQNIHKCSKFLKVLLSGLKIVLVPFKALLSTFVNILSKVFYNIHWIFYNVFPPLLKLKQICLKFVFCGGDWELILLESKFAASLTGDIGPDRDRRAKTHELNFKLQ